MRGVRSNVQLNGEVGDKLGNKQKVGGEETGPDINSTDRQCGEREGDGTISKMSNFSVEGFSRPVSPTTHLHKVKEYGKIFKNILTSL